MDETERLTMKTARARLAEIDYTIRRTGDGELRVAPKGGTEEQREARAYYTTDLADAVGTAKAERIREVFHDAAITTVLNRLLDETMTSQHRQDGPVDRYPAERLMSRFAGINRDDTGNER